MKAITDQSLIWLPAVLGAGFPLLVKLEHWLFSKSVVGVRFLIGIEAVYLLICAFALVWVLNLTVRVVRLNRLRDAVWIVISIALCLYFLGLGIESGAAVVYAT